MSRNISREKRESLLAKIRELRVFLEGANATPTMKAYLSELESELKRQKFGLVFEEHKEEIDEILEIHTPVLTEDKSLFINNGGPMNFLIEGDNLAALTLLEKTHKGKIDVIYIDPPYNTRKEGFTYSDRRVDVNDGFRHSKWLSFMNQRLLTAKKILSEKGVIFISVDENEFAEIKILADNLFNEICFVECLVWNKRVPKNDKGIGNIHEYILVYTNNAEYKYKFLMPKDGLEDISTLMADCKKKKLPIQETEKLLKDLYRRKAYDRAITLYNMVDENYRVWGKINMSWPNGNTFGPRYDVIHPKTKKAVRVPDRGWRWSEDTFAKTVDYQNAILRYDGSYMCGGIWFSKDENMQPSSIKYLDEVDRMLLRSIISLKSDGSIELEKCLGEKSIFPYPKPVALVRTIIDSITYNNDYCTILDFFAGSGTTGHAVMELNKQDGGNRKFILCTNNENGICRDVTYERIKTVITGKRKDGTTYGEPLPASLKYQRIDFIRTSEQTYYDYADELLLHIRELVELENAINFEGNNDLAILLTEDEVEQFFANEDKLNSVKTIYLGHDIALTLKQQQRVADNNVTLNVIPEYYYKEQQI